jgi:hypothetical protein
MLSVYFSTNFVNLFSLDNPRVTQAFIF